MAWASAISASLARSFRALDMSCLCELVLKKIVRCTLIEKKGDCADVCEVGTSSVTGKDSFDCA